MALDLSINSLQSCPLDLSMKKGKAAQMHSKTASKSAAVLSKVVTFAGSTSKVSRKSKPQTSWCLKKRILQCHKEVLEKEKENQRKECCAYIDECAKTVDDCKANRLYLPGSEVGVTAAVAYPCVNTDGVERCLQATVPEDCDADFTSFPLPLDPRDWSRLDVHIWLLHMKMTFDLNDVHPERFPMNGKGLCLMSVDMFNYRVPDAGKILYRDFRLRLSRAMAVQTSRAH